MIAIFNFKDQEPEKVPAWQYALAFILISIILSIALKLTFFYLGFDQSTGAKTTAPSAMIVAYMFVYKYKRIMTKSERLKITAYSIVLTYIITALYLFSILEAPTKIELVPTITILAFVTLFMYFLLYFCFGWFSKMILKQMEKAAEAEKAKP